MVLELVSMLPDYSVPFFALQAEFSRPGLLEGLGMTQLGSSTFDKGRDHS